MTKMYHSQNEEPYDLTDDYSEEVQEYEQYTPTEQEEQEAQAAWERAQEEGM